jgi:hypothetical protein
MKMIRMQMVVTAYSVWIKQKTYLARLVVISTAGIVSSNIAVLNSNVQPVDQKLQPIRSYSSLIIIDFKYDAK